MSRLFQRLTLDQLCDVPEVIIDVYVVERHIWKGGTIDDETESKRNRRAELRTVEDFLIDPVRSLLNDVLRQLAAPYDPNRKDNPIGQGWWIQAEFGTGKSHLLAFIGALAIGDEKAWAIVMVLETKNKKGKREEISSRVGHTIRCNVLAVPHHAGRSHQSPEELQWLFTQAIRPEVAVISVGTSNTHDHPREDVIEAIRAVQATILCTQITRKCCANLEALRPGVLRPIKLLGRSSTKRDLTPRGHSRNVACAGTVLVHVTPTTLVVDGIDQHQTAVDQLVGKPYGYPLCRPKIVRD